LLPCPSLSREASRARAGEGLEKNKRKFTVIELWATSEALEMYFLVIIRLARKNVRNADTGMVRISARVDARTTG
jgi:hypothetical protein